MSGLQSRQNTGQGTATSSPVTDSATGTSWPCQLALWLEDACLAEVLARKPGNVHPGASFDDATADDFVQSAQAIAPVIAGVAAGQCGQTILNAAQATHEIVGHNTNLGIILLLTPLAAVKPGVPLRKGIDSVLSALTVEDAVLTYRAIAVAEPAGLGEAPDQDLTSVPTRNLRACMRLAAHRDLIAAQYDNGFREVLDSGRHLLQQCLSWQNHKEDRLAWLATHFIAQHGDSLVARKCGSAENTSIREMAHHVLDSGFPFDQRGQTAYDQFDAYLRTAGNRRNPGTTADLVAATIFAALRDGVCCARRRADGIDLWRPTGAS